MSGDQLFSKIGGKPHHQVSTAHLIHGKPLKFYREESEKCRVEGCKTILSRYTPWPLCENHKGQSEGDRIIEEKRRELWEGKMRGRFGAKWNEELVDIKTKKAEEKKRKKEKNKKQKKI